MKSNHKVNWLIFLNNRGEVDPAPKGDANVEAMKAELAALKESKGKLEKELEDVRMEVLTPEYTKFLEELEKSKSTPKPEKKEVPADDFEKLSKKEILERAKKEALDEFNATLSKQREDTKKATDEKTRREVAMFAKTHDDYEKYRPVMYGLSLDPNNQDLSLAQLYEKAKMHMDEIVKEKEEAIRKQRTIATEKPGLDSSSLEKFKKMSNSEIASEALSEVKEKLGPLPAA